MLIPTRYATTSAPVIDPIEARWSPRSFDAEAALPEGALTGVLEAARWAASANNTQPWRFIVARRGSETSAKITSALLGFNQSWAGSASALIVAVTETESAAGNEQRWAEYDLGQAVANMVIQAQSEGLHAHQMGGFNPEKLSELFDLSPHQVAVSVIALGTLASPELLPEVLREREVAPRVRIELDDLILLND